MILLLDNYDSFTFNLWQAMAALGVEGQVARNDALTVEAALGLHPSAIVLSPGPGRPADAGIQPELLRRAPDDLPLLGICLGHQGLVESLGGTIERDPVPVHGRACPIHHDGGGLFQGLPNPFPAGRYHSLRARADALPKVLVRTAWTEDGIVMAVRHVSLPRFGIQFHPESILTPQGDRILARFLEVAGERPLSPSRETESTEEVRP